MKDVFTPDQRADLVTIREFCAELNADLVLIGAMSLLVSMEDIGRFTRDVDLTVALDLDEFALLTDRLTGAGWTRVPRLEHRWIAPRKTIVDLLPAGHKLRSAGSIEWPLSQFAMSLAGFDHVFADALDLLLDNGAHIRVAPPIVTVLLKIIAYTEDPHRRAKDLDDIRLVLRRYEADSDRLFSDAVFDAELPDFSEANAFLLGCDLRSLASKAEAAYVERFIEHFFALAEREPSPDDFAGRDFKGQLRAFERGFQRE